MLKLVFLSLVAVSHAQAASYLAQSNNLKPVKGDSSFSFKIGEKSFAVSTAELPQSADDLKNELPKEKGPAIWITEGKNEMVVDLRKPFAKRFPERVFVDGTRVWVLLEWGVEGPAGEYEVVSTKDGGKTWTRLADLKKPPFKFPPSSLDTFFMDAKGNGKAVFKLEHGDSSDFYLATTANGGRSWTYTKSVWARSSVTDVEATN